jgi:hypothetical protein
MPKKKRKKPADNLGPAGTLLLEDRWLNEMGDWLTRTAEACEKVFGRKPTIEDLRTLMATVLKANAPERWFADGDRQVVKDVIFKLSARPSIPRQLQPGDVLAIPLGTLGYAFARVMYVERGNYELIEVFRKQSAKPRPDRDVVVSGRLFHPVFVSQLDFIESGRWTVVATDADYRVREDDRGLEFAGVPGGEWSAITPLDPGRPPRRLRPGEKDGMVLEAVEAPAEVEDQIRKALRSQNWFG